MAEKFTSRPLYPATVETYVHPFGTCEGYRDMSDFNYTDAYHKESIRQTGKAPKGFPRLDDMRRLFIASRARSARKDSAAIARAVEERTAKERPLETISARPFDVLRNAPRNITEDGLLNLSINDTIVVEDTRVWEHLLPDERELFASEHESGHYVMARMLAVFTAVCEKYNLRSWFITHGTLLGAVRHGGFIPWDVDVDIAMSKSQMTLLRKVWRKEFPRDMFLQTEKTEPSFHMWIGMERGVRLKDRYSSHIGVSFDTKKKGKRYRGKPFHVGVHLDIIPIERKRRGSQMKIFFNFFNRSLIFPTTAVCFENMVVPAPRNVRQFLIDLYGKDYMTISPEHAILPPRLSHPCLAAIPSRGSHWSLNWLRDGRATGNATVPLRGAKRLEDVNASLTPVLYPRGDPSGSFNDDYRFPYA
jgi:hypothetical protein